MITRADQQNESQTDPALAELFEELSNRFQRGESLDAEAYIAAHPQYAEPLRRFIPAIELLVGLGDSANRPAGVAGAGSDPAELGILGDYRVIRIIGRGGMGVVYEAEQISLARRVALKVLPFAAVLDAVQLRRFINEAHAAAQLHHTNIVPVYAVGSERGVHYYAMQYIEGGTLAEVIRELRQDAGRASQRDAGSSPGIQHSPPDSPGRSPSAPTIRSPAIQSRSRSTATSLANASTNPTTNSPEYFRTVARLGIQAAEALEHAHQLGIVHRDIKPSNLLLDVRGNLWITDFGLALVQSNSNLTGTGDLLGTVRYMSPEQAQGNRLLVDHRTDVYSLGITLYELLTLEPGFAGDDRHDLLRRLVIEDPAPLRRSNRSIPSEIETIVLKATAKDPAKRYDTAQDMADDLRRFIEDKPINARRPNVIERLSKWSRRHRGLVVATSGLLAVLFLCLAVSALLIMAEQARTKRALSSATANFVRAESERRKAEEQTDTARAAQARAERAELELKEKLWRSYLDQARSLRRSRRIGQRADSLAALENAAAIARSLNTDHDSMQMLRNEAIACMALTDLQVVRKFQITTDKTAVTFDGAIERYAEGESNGSITIRRAEDGQELARLPSFGPRVSFHGLLFSPDGRKLAAHYTSGECRIWDPDHGALLHKFAVDRDWQSNCKFSPDSQRVAFRRGNSLIVADLSSGAENQSFAHRDRPTVFEFHPRANKIAVVTTNREVQVRDLDTGLVDQTFAHRGIVFDVAWARDGRILATGCDDCRIHLWNVDSGDEYASLSGHHSTVVSLTFQGGGGVLASHSWDTTMRLWDPVSGSELLRIAAQNMQFSGDGRTLATTYSRDITIWKVTSPHECQSFVYSTDNDLANDFVTFSPDDNLLVSAGEDGVRFWNLPAGEEIASLHLGLTRTVVFDRDGSMVTTGMAGVSRWPIAPDYERENLVFGPPELLMPAVPENIAFTRSAMSANGNRIAAITSFTEIRVRDLDGSISDRTLGGLRKPASVSITPDGNWIAAGNYQAAGVMLWNGETGELIQDLWPDSGGSTDVAFSPDGSWLVGSNSYEYRLWEVGSWALRRRIPRKETGEHGGPCAFTSDGKIAAIVQSPWKVHLLDMENGVEFAALEAPDSAKANSLCFSRDGRKLACGSRTAIRVWNLDAVRARLAEMKLNWVGEFQDSSESPFVPRTAQVLWGDNEHRFLVASGRSYDRRTSMNQAIREYSRAVELQPDVAEPYARRANLYVEKREFAKAIADYERLMAIEPGNARDCNELAWIYATGPIELRDPARALSLAQAAVEQAPTNSLYTNTLGVALYRLGRFQEAVTTLEAAGRLSRTGPTAFDWFFIAMSQYRLGNIDQARTGFEQARRWWHSQKDPSSSWIEELTAIQAEAESVLGESLSQK